MTAAGRITRDGASYVFLKPLAFEEKEAVDAFLLSAKRKGYTAMSWENDEEVKVKLFRNEEKR